MDISQINTSVCSRGSAPAPWTYTATRRIANQYERCVFVPHNGAAEGNFFLRRMCTPDCSLTDRWWHGARGSACNIRLLSPHVCDRPDSADATTVAGGSPAWCGESLMAWVRQPPRASRPVPTIFRELGHATPQSTAPRVVTDDELYCVLLPTSDFRIQVSAHHG
ncbi:hypothetical protein IG631_09751 [Alternaria alternata]|nr:hypothetical protein IG631_09751 [Alternaria alternata]